jgi:hypothetical protein
MKSLTLASLLATSAVVGAGAASVGGPFFLAVTVPFGKVFERSDFVTASNPPLGYSTGSAAVWTAPTPTVIRGVRFNSEYRANNNTAAVLTVINPNTAARTIIANVNVDSQREEPFRFEDGLLVPRGHQLEIYSTRSVGSFPQFGLVFIEGYNY